MEIETTETDAQATNEIAGALAKAQAKFKPIKKTKKGQIGNQSYMYAQLSDVIEAIRAPLSDNGLAFTQLIKPVEGKCYLITTLLHSSGQRLESLYGLPDPTVMDPKAYGKNLTYSRRYSLCSIVGVESEDDTDGNGAESMGKKAPQGKQAPRPRAHQNNPTRNHAPTSRVLNQKEIEATWGRLSTEFNLRPDEVKFLCKELYNRPGLAKLTLNDAKDLIARVEKEGPQLIDSLADNKVKK